MPLVIADVARNSARDDEKATRLVAVVWTWGVAQIVVSCADAVAGAGMSVPGFTIPSVDTSSAAAMSMTTVLMSVVLVVLTTGAQALLVEMITREQHARATHALGTQFRTETGFAIP